MINHRTQYFPDWESECRLCDTSPCVIVFDSELRTNSATELCGTCFFADRLMIDPERWNEDLEATE
jgi:hypothetical protein